MNTLPTYPEFEARARAAGFDEVLERRWAPDTVVATHTHPFAVDALVVEGEFWLTCGGQTRHLRAGDRFALEREVPHEERYGQDGAVFWAARRH
jgi:mannose-6-phosphate isomerase-like protein (cupin superfamily)